MAALCYLHICLIYAYVRVLLIQSNPFNSLPKEGVMLVESEMRAHIAMKADR